MGQHRSMRLGSEMGLIVRTATQIHPVNLKNTKIWMLLIGIARFMRAMLEEGEAIRNSLQNLLDSLPTMAKLTVFIENFKKMQDF